MGAVTRSGTLVNAGTLDDLRVAGTDAVEDAARLDGASCLTLLAWAGLRKASGVLRLAPADGGAATVLGLAQGSVLTLSRDGVSFDDAVLRWLKEHRVIGPGQAEAARASGKPLLQALYETKACSPQDLVGALKGAKEELLADLVAPGTWAFAWAEGAPVRRTDPVALDLVTVVVNAIRLLTRNSYASDMDPLLASVSGRYPYRTAALTPAIAGVVFSDKEQKVLEQAADGTNTLKEATAMSLLSHTQTDRLVLIAAFLGFVEFRIQGLPKGGVETLEKEMKATAERLKGEDLFQRLGLHWTTHPKHYTDAYRKMVERWGPDSRVRQHSALCAELAEEILGLMDEAFRMIEPHAGRNAYRLQRLGKETLIFGTDFLFKQANLALFRQEWDQALEIIESAIDVLPRSEFLALRDRVLARGKAGPKAGPEG